MNRALAAVAAAACALLVGCSGGGSSSPPSGTPKSTPGATSSVGASVAGGTCATAKVHAAGTTTERINSGGVTRSYILHVPPSYDGTKALPLVINLHGSGSNAAQEVFYTGFNKKADDESFITIAPDATAESGHTWNFIPAPSGPDDVGFVRDAVDRTEGDLCIDTARVYATGISAGAAMSVRIACSLSPRIAAIGIVAALWYPPDCPAHPVAVLEFHGTADPLVPFGGGTVATSGIPAPSVESAAAQWAKADGCAADAVRATFSAHVRTVTYGACAGGSDVGLYIVEGGGHTWPGASVQVTTLGATTQEVSATDVIWAFLAAHGGR